MVGRWLPDAKQRLRSAALELIAEQGFAATTVPQITARADLTTRTPTLAARAVSHLRPQSAISFDGRVLGSGPDETPDELRRCDADQAIPPTAQQLLATGCQELLHLGTGHTPMLADPGAVARILRDRLNRPDRPVANS